MAAHPRAHSVLAAAVAGVLSLVLGITLASPTALPAVAAPYPYAGIHDAAAVAATVADPAGAGPSPLTSPGAAGSLSVVVGDGPGRLPALGSGALGSRGVSSGVRMGPAPANTAGAGDFAALPGSGAGSWGVAGQTGGFTWSYPFGLRAAPAGPTPQLALSYDSTRVDGLTSATNNQASVVGDGWGLAGAGRITQRFAPCTDQGVPGSYDLCGNPGGQRISVSFGGRSSELIKDAATGVWRLRNDDGTRVEYLTGTANGTFDGGHWKLTDPSGVQYFFGLNRLPGWTSGQADTASADTVPVGAADPAQPCAAGTFAASLCQQAYGWNLDYVVDVNGNSQAFYYTQDTNSYQAMNGTGSILPYVRASRLARVEYGMRAGSELTAQAPLRAVLSYEGRCTGVDCAKGSDVPDGLSCPAAGPCSIYSPTFYTDQRLAAVQTETLVGASYQGADRWTLKHSMPDPGDGSKPSLWLGSLTHSGIDTSTGTAAIDDPATVFSGQTLQNRVWAVDGLAPLNRYRITTVKSPTGAVTAVAYNGADCTPTDLPAAPETNTRRCFPQWWTPTSPIVQAARMDWFHIYPVQAVSVDAGPGGQGSATQTTRYEYLGTPAWKYPEPVYRTGPAGSKLTWSVLAGWAQVKTTNAAATTIATYLRGLDGTPSDTVGGKHTTAQATAEGTPVTDSPWLAGRTLQTEAFLGETGTRLTATVAFPWSSAPTATGPAALGSPEARHTGTGRTWGSAAVAAGTRVTETTTTYDKIGRPTSVSDRGDTATGTDDTCTVTVYADSASRNLLRLPAATSIHAEACNPDGAPAGDLLKSAQTLYDGSAAALPGTPGYTEPTRALPTATRTASAVAGQAATAWQPGPVLAYDDLGRPVSATDSTTGTERTTTTAYTPTAGPVTATSVTNPLGWTSTTEYSAVRGTTVKATDPNGSVAETAYDASGRPTGSWDPLRPRATNPVPSTATAYSITQDTPSWVKTTRVNSSGGTTGSWTVYDGLGRPRQTQTPSLAGGTVATDTLYNAAGKIGLTRNRYYMTDTPTGALLLPTLAVPSSTAYEYDGAGRLSRTRGLAWDDQEQWATAVERTGTDTTVITGPGTTAATRTVTDADGHTTTLTTYHAPTPAGPADTVSYTHDRLGTLTGMVDQAGASWSWTVDPLGREISRTDPDTGTTSTTYDTAGRRAATTDATGTTTSYTYDLLDRVTRTATALPGQGPKTLTTAVYDTEKKGQTTTTTRFNGPNQDEPVTTAYTSYNAAYQPGSAKTTLPGAFGTLAATYETKTTYGRTGLPTYATHPAAGPLPAEAVQHGYNGLDMPSALISQTGVRYVTNVAYNNVNLLGGYDQNDSKLFTTGADTMGSTKHTLTWDFTTGRITGSRAYNEAKGTTTDLGTTDYTYDPAGRLTSRTFSYPTRTSPPAPDRQCYTYDWAGRLAEAWTTGSADCGARFTPEGIGGPSPYAQTHEYNSSGDRSSTTRYNPDGTTAATENYAYGNGGPHRLTNITRTTPAVTTTDTFGYDAAGRMTDRAGQAITYTPDGKIATTTGTSTIPANPNPGAAAPAPTGPAAAKAATRYYSAEGSLAGIIDGTGTTALIGAATVFKPAGTGPTTATRTYTFAGKTVAQRTATTAATGTQTAFITGDTLNTAQTITGPTTGGGTTPITVTTRRTDPYGLTRAPTLTASGNTPFTTAPPTATGPGTNGTNPTGFSAATGYITGTADAASALTHLGARDYDPVTGAFTAPDPLLDLANPNHYSPYAYSEHDPINHSDPTGLLAGPALSDDSGSWHSPTATTTPGQWQPVYPEYLDPVDPFRTYAPGTWVNTSYAGNAPPYVAPPPPPAPGWTGDSTAAFGPTAAEMSAAAGRELTAQQALAEAIRWLGYAGSLIPGWGVGILAATTIGANLLEGKDPLSVEDAAMIALAAIPGGAIAGKLGKAAKGAADGVSLTLKYKHGWTAAQRAAADAKVAALNSADDLVVTQVQRSGTSAGTQFRAAGGVVPRGSDVDHVIDLQLGGADGILNMSPLDMSVNRSLGAQIANQIRGLEPGTRICSVSICSR